MLLLDWRLHGEYRYLDTKSTFLQCEKRRHSPERPYWLEMLIVDCVFKVLLLIVKPLAPGNMDMVVERQIDDKKEGMLTCER